ncbi:MAG TPA: hypothetical protein VKB84_25565 [Candidatus Binataceae bacterium]|nr:hypothetical protein [Candidatus Binataceae bacterium]
MQSSTTTLALAALLGLSACATVQTRWARGSSDAPDGVRVYPPKVYLMVDNKAQQSTLTMLPDYENAYDIKPLTIFAKNNFSIQTDDGQVKAFSDDQDTTAFLTFLYEAGQAAAKGAGLPVSSQVMKGTFGLPDGIYVMDQTGTFRRRN